MYILNRSAVVIKLKQPYLDWANSLPDATPYELDFINRENHVYLIQEYDNDEHLESIVKNMYSYIFEAELDSWYRDTDFWPENRDYRTFKKWFEVMPHSMIFDTLEEDLEGEEY